MNSGNLIANYFLIPVVAGLLGVAALEFAMWLIRRGWTQGSMIVAVGSLLTHSRTNAFRVGTIVHLCAGVGFAMLYAWALRHLGWNHLPMAFTAGIGFGAVHGIMVSLMLVWIVAEHHPLEEFNDAGLAIGVNHFVGHVAFGAVVGLVIGALS